MHAATHLGASLLGLFSLVAAIPAPAPMPMPTPPGIPSAASAKTALAGLTVATQVDDGNYDRDLFPHWSSQGNSCNTREFVLQRDGTGVVVNAACTATSGSWFSPYDGATWTAASDVDIDHMIPLKNAWISGASAWTTARRESFANDITRPQLWAVTDNVNQGKGDKNPADWKPPLTSFYCTYARSWVQVKSYYALTISAAEKTALTSMLNTC
ncbi:unnamed protein product [Discula destructiva]